MTSGASATLATPYPDPSNPATRLWRAFISEPDVLRLLHRHGRAITYGYLPGRWSMENYQTVFAIHPGSAEMPSAGRPFTAELVTALVTLGVRIAPLTLHTGVSSPEAGEAPTPGSPPVAAGPTSFSGLIGRPGSWTG